MSTPIARFPAARPRVVGVVRAGGVRRAPRGVARGLGGSSIVVSRLVRRERRGAAFVRRPARSSAARGARSSGDDGVGGDEASTVGAASDAPPPLPFEVPPPAPAAIAADAPLKAGSIVREILASTRRDFLPAATIICVAGACAQALNLGGTFVLALLNVHDVEVVAVLFLALVNFWKLCCETLARIAQFRNARDVDAGEQTRFARVSLGGAWDAVARAYAAWRLVLFIDARRLLSIAWNSVLTIPIPYLGVVKLLDYALCVPVFLFEGETGARCLERSRELMLGNRLLLLRVALALAGLASLSAGLVVGVFSVLVPTLPALLTETPVADAAAADAAAAAAAKGLESAASESAAAAAASSSAAAEAAAGIFTGSAFDRVWDVGTNAEKWATIALLTFAVVGSFAVTVTLRQTVYVFYREVRARWEPPPEPEPEGESEGKRGKIRAFFARMMFWKKVEDGDLAEAVKARAAELRGKEEAARGEGGDPTGGRKEKNAGEGAAGEGGEEPPRGKP